VASYSITPSLLHQWCESNVESLRFTFQSSHGNTGKKNAAKRKQSKQKSKEQPKTSSSNPQQQLQNLPPGVRLRGVPFHSSGSAYASQQQGSSAPVVVLPPQEHANLLRDFQSMQAKYHSLQKECEALRHIQQVFETTQPDNSISGLSPPATTEMLSNTVHFHQDQNQPMTHQRGESLDQATHRSSLPRKRRRLNHESSSPSDLLQQDRLEERDSFFSRASTSKSNTTTINGVPFADSKIVKISPEFGKVNTPLETRLTLEGFSGDVEVYVSSSISSSDSNPPAASSTLKRLVLSHRVSSSSVSPGNNQHVLTVPLGSYTTPQTLKIWASSRTTHQTTNCVRFTVTQELCSASPECSSTSLLTLDDQVDFDLDLLDIFSTEKADISADNSSDVFLFDSSPSSMDFFRSLSFKKEAGMSQTFGANGEITANKRTAAAGQDKRETHLIQQQQQHKATCGTLQEIPAIRRVDLKTTVMDQSKITLDSSQCNDEQPILQPSKLHNQLKCMDSDRNNTSNQQHTVLREPSTPHKKLAILIGNEKYDRLPALHSSILDIGKMHSALENRGFTVVRIENSTKNAFLSHMSQIKTEFDSHPLQDVIVLYSGHAVKERLCPTDADLQNKLEESTVAYSTVVQLLPSAEQCLLMLDCCDSGSGHFLKDQLAQGTPQLRNIHVLSSVSQLDVGPSVESDSMSGGILTSAFVATIAKQYQSSEQPLTARQIYESIQNFYAENFEFMSMDATVQSPELSQVLGTSDYIFAE